MRLRRLLRLLPPLVFVASLAVLPRLVCGLGAHDRFVGDVDAQRPLADAMASWATTTAGQTHHSTGSDLYDAEWRLVSCQMTVLGLGQVIEEHPELRDAYLPAMEACLDWMITPEATAFGARRWGQEPGPIEGQGTHAYLGYINVALSMHRKVAPDSRFAALNDRLTEAFAERLRREPFFALATYPGESFPADQATVVGSIGLYDAATGADHRDALDRYEASLVAHAIDPDSGLLYQAFDPASGRAVDVPRASGTAFSAYFLSFASMPLSRRLYDALAARCHGTTLGFGGIDEYPPGVAGGFGDVDSGPVLFGVGTSATGFALAAARIHGDEAVYTSITRTATLFGVPRDRGGQRRYLMGGAIGNGLLLAMTTAHGRTP